MTESGVATTPTPPYFAVIFTSRRTDRDNGYAETADRMVELALGRDGFLGIESVRAADGTGITVSYWSDEKAIADWRADAEHQLAQARGKAEWYEEYSVRVARVMRAYGQPG